MNNNGPFGDTSPAGSHSGIQGQVNENNSTTINIDINSHATSPSQRRSMQSNLLNFFNEARFQLARQTSFPDTAVRNTLGTNSISGSNSELFRGHQSRHTDNNNELPFANLQNNRLRNTRSWRMNLNDVLAFSTTPSTLHSLISHSSGLRYTPLNAGSSTESPTEIGEEIRLNTRLGRSQSMQPNERIDRPPQLHHSSSTSSAIGGLSSPTDASVINPARGTDTTEAHVPESVIHVQEANNHYNQQGGHADTDEDYNVISEIIVSFLSHILRYLPFICILLLKFIYDQIRGIVDVLILHVIMSLMNKSLREQVSKLSQKSYSVLMRILTFVIIIVSYRILLNGANPDPYGMLINPFNERPDVDGSAEERTTEHQNANEYKKNESSATGSHLTFGTLLYYVIVNDLILKLITIALKTVITLMSTKIIRQKPRARIYGVVEYLSQTYRALSPIHQYILFLGVAPSESDVFSRILFASLYITAKGYEIYIRGKYLHKAIVNLIKNMDYERRPTKEELDAVDNTCPICHDSFNNPTIILECSHIFCDDCINTWLKRQQTCPLCRTKISEDQNWQDGSTSFFYQLC